MAEALGRRYARDAVAIACALASQLRSVVSRCLCRGYVVPVHGYQWVLLGLLLLGCNEGGGVPAAPAVSAGVGGSLSASTVSSAAQGGHGLVGQGGQGGMPSGMGGSGGVPWQPVETEWCSEGWQGLDERTCFYVPSQPNGEVLVFLHGMMPPDASPAGMQKMVRDEAEKRGAVALFPQGRTGLCSWAEEVKSWYCWPTSRSHVDQHAAPLFAEFEHDLLLVQSLFGLALTKTYVLGFSNGGYFASYAALENGWPVAGVGLVAAGRSFVDTALLPTHRPPVFIRVGELDQTSVKNSAQNLAFVLSQESWPHDFKLQAGKGHELWPSDVAAAFATWD